MIPIDSCNVDSFVLCRPSGLSNWVNYTKVLVVLRVGSKGKINGFLNHFYNYMQFAGICPVPSGHQTNNAIATHLAIPVGDFSVWCPHLLGVWKEELPRKIDSQCQLSSLITHPRLVNDLPLIIPCLAYNYWSVEMEEMSAICCIRMFICSS